MPIHGGMLSSTDETVTVTTNVAIEMLRQPVLLCDCDVSEQCRVEANHRQHSPTLEAIHNVPKKHGSNAVIRLLTLLAVLGTRRHDESLRSGERERREGDERKWEYENVEWSVE